MYTRLQTIWCWLEHVTYVCKNKSLLRKDARLRTEDDIENLYRVIGNLKCFRRYPEVRIPTNRRLM